MLYWRRYTQRLAYLTSGEVHSEGEVPITRRFEMGIELQFHQEILRIYDEATTFGYRPTRFLQMVNEYGGLQTVRTLLGKDAPSYGFERLWEEGRLDLSVEALALREPWRGLFDLDKLGEAYRRLDGSDYDPGEPP